MLHLVEEDYLPTGLGVMLACFLPRNPVVGPPRPTSSLTPALPSSSTLNSKHPPTWLGLLETSAQEFSDHNTCSPSLLQLPAQVADVLLGQAAWGFTILSLWDIVENFAYPQASGIPLFAQEEVPLSERFTTWT